MKKFLVLLLCLMLALPASAEEPDRAALQAEWTRLLSFYESVQLAESWALSAAEVYLASGTWEDLLNARLAASSAYMYLADALEVPAASLPAEQYALWMQQGHDLTYVPMQFAALSQEQMSALNILTSLQEKLEFNVFWQPDEDVLQRWVTSQQDILANERVLICNMTNALSLSAPESVRAAEQAAYAAAAPTLFADHTVWSDDMDSLEGAYSAGLDQLEVYINIQSAILGDMEIYGDLYLSLLSTGDDNALRQNAVTISGLPLLLADPGWTLPVLDYTYTETDGEEYYLTPGSSLSGRTVSTALLWEAVTRQDFDTYVDMLIQAGTPIYKDESTAAERTVYFDAADYSFALCWSEDCSFLLSSDPSVCLVPAWYLQ